MPAAGVYDPGFFAREAEEQERKQREEAERQQRLGPGAYGDQPFTTRPGDPGGLSRAPGTPPSGTFVAPNPQHAGVTRSGTPNWQGQYVEPGADLTSLRDRFLAERSGINTTSPTLNTGRVDEIRGRQLGHLDTLEGIASGRTPGIADAQRRAAMMDVTQNTLGIAAAGDPGSRRMAVRALSDQGRRAGIDAALVAANEQAQARGQIAGTLDQVSGADRAIAIQNLEAGLRTRGLDVEERMGLGKLGLEAEQTVSATRMNEAKIQDLKDQLKFAYAQMDRAKDENERNRWFGLVGSILGSLGAVGAAAAGGK